MTQELVSPSTSITNEAADRAGGAEKPAVTRKRSFNLF
jgi:hypothetical protein